MTKAKEKGKLSSLGNEAVKLIEDTLKDMAKDLKLAKAERVYSLTDRMKVLDRAAKFEAIRSRIDDDEGSWFGDKGADDVDE